MPAGFNETLDRPKVDNMLGRATQDLNVAFRNVMSTMEFLSAYTDDELAGLDYKPEDIANIRSGIGDLEQLRRIYEGQEALDSPKEFKLFAQRLYGTGFTGA